MSRFVLTSAPTERVALERVDGRAKHLQTRPSRRFLITRAPLEVNLQSRHGKSERLRADRLPGYAVDRGRVPASFSERFRDTRLAYPQGLLSSVDADSNRRAKLGSTIRPYLATGFGSMRLGSGRTTVRTTFSLMRSRLKVFRSAPHTCEILKDQSRQQHDTAIGTDTPLSL